MQWFGAGVVADGLAVVLDRVFPNESRAMSG